MADPAALAAGFSGAVPSRWEQVAVIRAAWINRNGFLYAYQAEVGLNLDLLAAVKRESLAGVSAGVEDGVSHRI
jgi:hypothetical protein